MPARDGDYYNDEPEPRRSGHNIWLSISVVLAAVLLVGVALAFRAELQARDAEAVRREMALRDAEAARGGPRRAAVPLLEFYWAFRADAVTAERDHGAWPRFTMRVDRVEVDAAGGGCTVTQETGDPPSVARPRLVARFKTADGLRVGETVTARGRISTATRSMLVLVDCELD